MGKEWIFDIPWAREFAITRQVFVREFLEAVRLQVSLKSALDVGCGVGDFSKFLSDLGFHAVGVDGREENVQEGRRRYPEIEFITENVEDIAVSQLGTSDLVLCFGLLYHLENPFRVVRNLHAVTGKLLLIETMCLPSSLPTMDLLDEGVSENQGLNYIAFYPSESCLIKLLYRAGFPFVYSFAGLPEDPLYTDTIWRRRQRTFIAASKVPIEAAHLILAKEAMRWVPGPSDPWTTRLSRSQLFCRARLALLKTFVAQLLKPFRRHRSSLGPDREACR